ncbi:MAG: ATP-binding SpoIIE family protein phosphatase [Gemmatimonadota bacterium]
MMSVTDLSQVGEARRAAGTLAADAGLDESERGTLAVIVTELATNLARHANQGVLALRVIGGPGACGIEALAIDKGPGISDLSRAMEDGYSTGGTAGKGLGAIQRMASEFDVTSAATGTVILARVWSAAGNRERKTRPRMEGAVCTPIAGERACGDGWLVMQTPTRTLAVIADGLGHGPEAARAADAALRMVRTHAQAGPAELIQLCHGALRPTRGAAMAIMEMRTDAEDIRFAGVGNIAGSIVTHTGTKSMASHNGTVGHSMYKVQEFSYPCPAEALVIMHSDGLMTRWRLDAYPGLVVRHPAVVAGVLHRDFIRGRDDATVLVTRAVPRADPAREFVT